MNDDIFEDLMNDEGATGMVDPVTGESYNPLEDFEQFQNNSKATIITNEDEGYRELPLNIMDDEDTNETKPSNTTVDDNLIIDLLKSKGFNPESIKIKDEDDDELKEVKFSELSDEEKLELLNYNQEELEFTDNEIEAIEFLRENQMSLEDLAKAIREKTIAELEQKSEPTYEVDDFSDDELFLIDFKNKYGEDFTEEELLVALDKAKENEDLYAKQMSKVRSNFKEYEQQAKEAEEQEALAQQEAKEQEYISKVVEVARSLNDMHDTVDLDDDDKEDILSFMFDKLPTGGTAMDKALDNPEMRYKVAWYIKNGDDVFKEIRQYYKDEISKLQKQIQTQTQTKPVTTKPQAFIKQNQHTTRSPKKLEDLF